MDAKIIPALQIDSKKNLTAEEFQKQLCSWLESRGLLCELRAYFRSNMIEILKNTALGSSMSCKYKQTISPKMQAINLLISEYFVHCQYHFSLCVFCTEVSLSNVLQNVSNTETETGTMVFKFSEKEVYNILEGIGILRHNKQSEKIYMSYCEQNEPLLFYFLPSSSLTNIISFEPRQSLEEMGGISSEAILDNITKILESSNVPPNEQTLLKCCIKQVYDKQREDYKKVITALKHQYKTELRRYKGKLHNIQKSFNSERNKLQKEILLLKQDLETHLLKHQLRNRDARNTSYKLTELDEQVQEVNVKSTITYCNKSTQCIEEKSKKLRQLDKEQQTFTNTSLESAVLKHVVQQLEKENNNLRIDNFNYCQQIDELANRASVLMTELNISQQNVVRLNNMLQAPPIFTTENLIGQNMNTQQIPQFTGAGEQCVGAIRRSPIINYRNLTRSKKSPEKATPASESSSGHCSPTDDLLQEAKKKLKNLELESDDIDRRIRSFADRYDFTSRLQETIEHASISDFKFNIPSDGSKANIFEFGKCMSRKSSNMDAESASNLSLISLTSESTSEDNALPSPNEKG